MDVYIELIKKFSTNGKKIIFIKDVAEVFATGVSTEEIKNIQLITIKDTDYGVYKISSLDIYKAIISKFPSAKINNIGEKEVLVIFDSKKKSENKILTALKIASVSVTLFFGTSTAIMSFHEDGEIPKLMKGYYKIFMGEETEKPYIMEIPYSIGLAVGITVFFNHCSKRKLTTDPTPIEVEMTTYEEEVIKNQLSTAKKGED